MTRCQPAGATAVAVLFFALLPSRAFALSDNLFGCYLISSHANARLVSTERNYAGNHRGMLRARSTARGPWEEYFAKQWRSAGRGVGFTAVANKLNARVETGFSGQDDNMIRAATPAETGRITAKELFWLEVPPRSDDGSVRNSGIQSRGNNKWISVELGYTGARYAMLRARNNFVGPWEKFTLVRC